MHDQVPFDKFVNANKLTVNIYMSGYVTGCEYIFAHQKQWSVGR